MPSPFLTAEWRWLAMLNYEIDPAVLKPFVPAGTELDSRDGKTWVSMVGFHFRYARLRGVAIPFHEHFEEVNLRFYVKRTVGGETRRGVVFIKELVPRVAIAWAARWFYNENYIAVPMRHRIHKYGLERRATYEWSYGGQEHHLELRAGNEPTVPPDDSFEAFITEHYWGYAKQRGRQHTRVPGGASALACLDRVCRGISLRRGGALRQGVRAVSYYRAGVSVSRRWLGGFGVSGRADLVRLGFTQRRNDRNEKPEFSRCGRCVVA